jgi:hypothetical protein
VNGEKIGQLHPAFPFLLPVKFHEADVQLFGPQAPEGGLARAA